MDLWTRIPDGWPRTLVRTVVYVALAWAIVAHWDTAPWDLSYAKL